VGRALLLDITILMDKQVAILATFSLALSTSIWLIYGLELTPAQQEEALDMVRAGASLRQVAECFRISYESVCRIVMRKQREPEE